MSTQCLRSGYIGYDGMGKPIPLLHRQAACAACVQYGFDEKTARDAVKKMSKLLENNKPHEAALSVRNVEKGFTIAMIYKLIGVLMTGEA